MKISLLNMIIFFDKIRNLNMEVFVMKILTWRARDKKQMTLMELSQKTGISKSTLNNIENEKVSPTIAQLELIAMALDTKITLLFDSEYK